MDIMPCDDEDAYVILVSREELERMTMLMSAPTRVDRETYDRDTHELRPFFRAVTGFDTSKNYIDIFKPLKDTVKDHKWAKLNDATTISEKDTQ